MILKKCAKKYLSKAVNFVLLQSNILVIYRIGRAIGDQVCMTSVVRSLSEQYSFKIVVISSYPMIFDHNPYVWKLIDANKFGDYLVRFLRFLSGGQIENFLFKEQGVPFVEFMRNDGSELHLVQAHSLHFKNEISHTRIVNQLFLTDQEIEQCRIKFNLPKRFSIIQPNAKATYTPNKQWELKNFQKVVDLRKDIYWVQVGGENEYLLKHVDDLRGETTLRELFYLISKAEFVLGNEGLLNHIASAFNTMSYVIFSGFSCMKLASYSNTIGFVSANVCEKSPCWLLEECGIEGKPCLSTIKPESVADKIV